LNVSNPFRVIAAALVLSTLSFAAGIAGDLTMADPPNYGERVVLRLPPELPADAVRAGPLPSLIATAAAAAPRIAPVRARPAPITPRSKPPIEQARPEAPKEDLDRAAKPDQRRKGG
jgi:hypothetical protein